MPGQRAGHVDALIKTAFRAVDYQYRRAFTYPAVFQHAERRLYRLAAPDEACAGGGQIMRKDCVDAGNEEDCETDKKDTLHGCPSSGAYPL